MSRNFSAGHFAGGIFNGGTLTVTNSTFSANGALNGGGIVNGHDSTLTVANSIFSDNGAAYSGGGIDNDGTLTVINSSFSGNAAGIVGGGIVNGGTLTITNSTFYDNSTVGGTGFPISADGGGIYSGTTATLTVTNSTFFRNSAVGRGGAIASSIGAVMITNTIIANSTSGGNCFGIGTDGGYNIDDGTTCGFTGAGCASTGGSSFCNTDPQLDPAPAYNGGPTQTIALLAGSPAIDAGDEFVCAEPPVSNLDQRGYLRPGTGHTVCSIGSYEADGVPPTACVEGAPATGCLTAAKSVVVIRKNAEGGAQDRLVWKWLRGAETSWADLGTPTQTTNYTLCLYAGTALASIALPAGSNWQTAGWTGLKYKDKAGIPDGAQKARLKSGAAGKAKALVKGKGTTLPDTLAPMLSLPVTVQLVNDTNSTCFETVYDSGDVIKNDTTQFKAKAP